METLSILLSRESETRRWKESGELSPATKELFDSVTPWCQDRQTVDVLMAEGQDSPLAYISSMLKAAPRGPCFEFCETFIHIVNNICVSLHADNSPCFKQLYKTGAIEQIIRLGAEAETAEMTMPAGILEIIRMDSRLVRKRFAPGTQGGDLLRQTLANPTTSNFPAFRSALKKLLDQSNQSQASSSNRPALLCRHCGATKEQMHTCARCKGAKYCSRECQKADWKLHKPICVESNRQLDRKSARSYLANALTSGAVHQAFPEMFAKAMTVGLETGNHPPPEDILLMLDQTNPSAKPCVRYVPHLLDRKEDLPVSWYEGRPEAYEEGVTGFLAHVSDQRSRMQPGQWLVAVRSYDGIAVYRQN